MSIKLWKIEWCNEKVDIRDSNEPNEFTTCYSTSTVKNEKLTYIVPLIIGAVSFP